MTRGPVNSVQVNPVNYIQRSTLTVVRRSETPRNYVGPPEHHIQWSGGPPKYPAQMKIVLCTKNLNNCRHWWAIMLETLCRSHPFHGTKHVFVIMSGMNT